ncbi:MAG TPA: glycosyltransferase family 4 protein [Candidatus Eisenbergiella merdipullorum]|uniref:Glycosyltransferase family 4 protein n=1 Tax=Candidatus Eisenbergiella merdipullorum TaxID=2838553 RepID=A0A9D2I705_9FIRM|nr:glycosyltransferase family 4 protein [Candidatus Eisenbergiella merdipullorum]
MRLVIDCFKLVKGQGKSIGIYNLAKNLTCHLAQTNRNGEHCEEIVVLGNSYNRKDFEVPGVRFVQVKGNPLSRVTYTLWELFGVPFAVRKAGGDRVLFPRGYRPLFYRGKDVIIIHDLIPFFYDKYFPGELNRVENAYIMSRLKASIRHADRIVTISQYSLKEMEKICPGCQDRTRVIYNGVNPVPCSDVPSPLKPDGPYLYAGVSPLPHKNAIGVLKTYDAYFKAEIREERDPARLVVIGIESPASIPGGEVLSPQAAKYVTCCRYIESGEEMHSLLAGARAFLFLSLIEGFGFPPLEAMQLGVPVICSNRSSLPEVIGDAGLLTDPDDIEGTVSCIRRLLGDEGLRQELIAKGYENVKRFDWDSRTEQYWEVLTR